MSLSDELMLPGYDPTDVDTSIYYYDSDVADSFVSLFSAMRIKIKDEIQPFTLPTWQQPIIRNLFGWYHVKHPRQRRRYKRVFLYIPRKNGKTTLGAAITLAEMMTTRVVNANMFSMSETVDNAQLIYNSAKEIIDESPLISEQMWAYKERLQSKRTGAKFSWLSSQSTGRQGFKPHFLLCDEVHDYTLKTEGSVRAMVGGMGATWNGMQLYFTTADCDRQSMCNEMYQEALEACSNPRNNPTLLPIVYHTDREVNLDDDNDRCAALAAANPNYGVGIDPEFYAEEWRKLRQSPRGIDFFNRFYLNKKTASGANGWLMPRAWESLPTDIDKSGYCVGGLDLATAFDFAAWCLWWPATKSMTWRLYCPDSAAQHIERVRSWPNATVFPGSIDHNVIMRDMLADIERHGVRRVGYDPAGASMLVAQLRERAGAVDYVKVSQYPSVLSPHIYDLERMIHAGELRQDGGEALAWMAGNCLAKRAPSGAQISLEKGGGKWGKIDGIDAAICALAAAATDKDNGGGGSSALFDPAAAAKIYGGK